MRMETKHKPMETKRKPDVEEAPKLYAIVVGGSNGQIDPEFAAALQEYCDARDKDANSWDNNPEKKEEARDEMGRLFAEWQEENGAFTERGVGPSTRAEVRCRPSFLIRGRSSPWTGAAGMCSLPCTQPSPMATPFSCPPG